MLSNLGYLIIRKDELETFKFFCAHDAAIFLWGRPVNAYLIIKDETKLIALKSREISEIEQELLAA